MMLVALGWVGSIIYLINHGYISLVKNWNPKLYYGGNLIAAVLLVMSSYALGTYQAVIINSFWAVISVLLLIRFDITRLTFPKSLFYAVLSVYLAVCCWIGLKHGFASSYFYTYLGWSSSYVFCFSYFLFSGKKLTHISYLLLNVYAATALLPLLWQQANWPVFTLEVCWALISAYGLFTRIDEVHLID